ncbi:hypothetical protein ACFU99_34960, partial [Streptomyces sp. NPDC057654]
DEYSHPKTGRRCYERGAYRSPLVVVPRDAEISDREAAGLPADQMIALCRGCFGRRRKKADSARAYANGVPPAAQLDLFPLPAQEGTAS